MKHNKLFAKSLYVGLAAAAIGMNTPVGLMSQVNVCAEEVSTEDMSEMEYIYMHTNERYAVGADFEILSLETTEGGKKDMSNYDFSWYLIDSGDNSDMNYDTDYDTDVSKLKPFATGCVKQHIKEEYLGKRFLVVAREKGSDKEAARTLSYKIRPYEMIPVGKGIGTCVPNVSGCHCDTEGNFFISSKDAVTLRVMDWEDRSKYYKISDSEEEIKTTQNEEYCMPKGKPGEEVKKTLYFRFNGRIYRDDFYVYYDGTAPEIKKTVISNQTRNSATVTVKATDDSIDNYSERGLIYTLKNKDPKSESPEPSYTGEFYFSELSPDKTYIYTLTVEDEAGNKTVYDKDIVVWENFTSRIDDVTVKVKISGKTTTVMLASNSKKVEVPEVVTDADGRMYKVTKLGAKAFMKCSMAEQIVLPAGIVSVDKKVFSGITTQDKKILLDASLTKNEAYTIQTKLRKAGFKGIIEQAGRN